MWPAFAAAGPTPYFPAASLTPNAAPLLLRPCQSALENLKSKEDSLHPLPGTIGGWRFLQGRRHQLRPLLCSLPPAALLPPEP